MEQYFLGRTIRKTSVIDSLGDKPITNCVFVDETVDKDWQKSHLKIKRSTFAEMGFRDSKFEQCDLSFCVFIDCYFKKTYFSQVNFLSCTFINCNFDMATFLNCDFSYVNFVDCFIPYSQMRSNLPHEKENLCADICRSLSLQCLSQGAIDDYKAYLYEERRAGETHAIKKLFHKRGTYYDKYNLVDGLGGLFEFLRSKLSKFLWGYGERMSALIRNIAIVIVLYGFIYFRHMSDIVWNAISPSSIVCALYLSACNFFSVTGKGVTNSVFLHAMELSEHILGLVLMGFFCAALFRQINRR